MITREMQIQKNEHDAWWAAARAEKNEATLEYVAMMADVELPDEDAEMEGNENV